MNNSHRKVARIIEPKAVMEGAGVKLIRSIATGTLDHVDPFLLFDHFGSKDPADYIKGFPMHPHRGIETVTYMISGRVNHKDSIGNSGSITDGDVQWMTSGRGIMHEEMPRRGPEGTPRCRGSRRSSAARSATGSGGSRCACGSSRPGPRSPSRARRARPCGCPPCAPR